MTTQNIQKTFQATGKRKTAVARVRLLPGEGKFVINGRTLNDYFPRPRHAIIVAEPFRVTGNEEKYDVFCNLHGGGSSGQAEALRHGISRALLELNQDYRKPLRKNGFLTRDARKVERKKYGRKKARKSEQYSKR